MTDPRAEFEAWATKTWGAHAWRHISATSGEWTSWQASRKVALEDSAKVCANRALSPSNNNQFAQSNEAQKCGSAIKDLLK